MQEGTAQTSRNLYEFIFIASLLVRMKLFAEFLVGLFNFLVRCFLAHSQHFIEVGASRYKKQEGQECERQQY